MPGLSLGERLFIEGGIAQDLRTDGRRRLTYRPIYVETGVIPQANGSARVKMGGTDVIASVKAEIGRPNALQPDKGKVSIYVTCSPTAAPMFEGRGGEELSAELSVALQQCLLGGKSGAGAGIDLSSLVVVEGKVCWDLYIDGLVVSSDGNLLDALGAAIKVSITPEVTSKGVNRAIIKELVKLYKLSHLGNRMPAYDGKKSLYTAVPLPFDSKEFKIILADKNNDTSDGSSSRRKGRERQFKVTIRYAAKGDLDHLQRFIEGRQLDCPHEIIQVLDVVLRTIPSAEYTVVGRSFFSTKFGKGDLGDGLVYWKGYYQSLPATQQGLSLNIDLSATAFYDEIDVIDFISMSLNFRHFSRPLPDNLVDRLMGYSRTRDMDSEELLEQLPSLQNLLYRLMGCQPEGAAVGNFFIQYALALVALKTLKVIHRALLEGDPTFTEELLNYSQQGRILQLSNFKDDSSPIAWDCSAWVRTYALFLEEILECFKIAKYDIEAERLPRPAQGQEKGYSRTRDMDSEEPLEQLPSLQNLLYRLMGCQPEGAAVGNFFIQYALALEIFKMHCAFNDGIINLSDKFFEMPRHEAVKALDVYKRAGQQGLNDDVVDPFSLEEKNALALAIVPSESDGGASHMAFNDSTGWELALVTARSSNTSSVTDRKLPLYIRSGREPTVFEPPVGLGNRTKTARVIHSGQYSCRDENELNISTETKEKKSLLERLSEKRVLLLGGEGFEDGAAGDFGKYHPLTDGIVELPGMTIPRSQAAAALLDDRIYFYGGVSPGTVHLDSHLNSVESYDLATNAWSPQPHMTRQRCSFVGVVLNGKLFALGGGIETPNHQEYYTDAEFLDVNLGAWVQFPDDMILARLGHAAVQLGGALYISGGSNWDLYFSVVETYDPRQPHWRPLLVMHSQRSNHSSVVFQDKIYAIGGTNHDGTLDTVEVYDPRMDVWEVDEFQMNVARESATSAVIGGSGSIYMIGGCSFDEEEEMDIADSVEVYRPGEGWTMLHDPSIVNTYAMASLVVLDDLVRNPT